MVKIVKVFKEELPNLRFIGKKYCDYDRGEDGGFGNKWTLWHQTGDFNILEKLGALPENGDAYLGFMSCIDGQFSYWIGMFFPENTSIPDGFGYLDIPKGNIGTCWIYGEQNGELYGAEPHNMCVAKIEENNWKIRSDFGDKKETYYFFEKYNCPRFTTPDENGKVILDYCFYVD